jgi:hypothetical protein
MSLSKETMLELMRYADGDAELDAASRARIEALLRASEEARGVVEAMGALGDFVREGASQRPGKSAAADAIADGVMAAIAQESVRVAPIARARRSRAGAASAVIVALALASGVIFSLRSKLPAPIAKVEPAVTARPAPAGEPEAPSALPAALAEAEGHGVDLEEVRSVRNKVDVFFMPPAVGASVVVWIDDRHGSQ